MRVWLLVAFGMLAVACAAPSAAQQVEQLPAVTVVTTAKESKPKSAKKTKPASPPVEAQAPSAGTKDAPATLPFTPLDVLDPRSSQVGVAQSASQGTVTAAELAATPVYRTGELLETVPGLTVTQHSGEGKANQYFLRGFNLDHGTDLAISVDGMPVNMRTHGHGQGYADTNFIIPEIVRGLSFHKGPYFAEEGDFASAGAVHLDVVDQTRPNFAKLEIGQFGQRHAVGAQTASLGVDGSIMVAGEIVGFNGPWENPDDLRKLNGVVRYSNGSYANGFALTAMTYSGRWNSTDQIPLNAVEAGDLDRFDAVDPTDGGASHRYSLSGRWHATDADSATRINAYLIKSDLDLFNNFTYFLNDPVNGDQFQQSDDRVIAGGTAAKTYYSTFPGMVQTAVTLGIDVRYDDIDVGLFNTRQRQRLSTVREDAVSESSVGVFMENTTRWTQWMRTTIGLRGDIFSVDVASNRGENSGEETDGMLRPKGGLVLGPWANTELYLNAGTGFHSNDARGTVTTIDPVSLANVDPSPLLVRSKGAEVGLRSQPTRDVTTTLAALVLDFDSEILFVGDAGTTEPSRPSRRIGAEFSLKAHLLRWLYLDLDAAYTQARFTDEDPAGDRIPGAAEGVISAGLSFAELWGGMFGGVHVRYFGPRPLTEDNSVQTKSSAPVSARLGYNFGHGLIVQVDGFNLLDETSSQIDYYYESRFPVAASPEGGIHFHPLEPRAFRLAITQQW